MKLRRHRYSTTITLDREPPLELSVSGVYIPEEPMVRYYKDGTGYPGSPACIDDLSATLEDGTEAELTDEEVEKCEHALLDTVTDASIDYDDDES